MKINVKMEIEIMMMLMMIMKKMKTSDTLLKQIQQKNQD